MYDYRAQLVSVHDGDTVTLDIDLGFYLTLRVPIRLAGAAARELRDPGGPEAAANLMAELSVWPQLGVSTSKPNRPIEPDKYAPRWDALIFLPDGTDLVEKLVAESWLARWSGRGQQPKPPWPRPVL